MGTTLSLIFRRLATKFSNLVQKKKKKSARRGAKTTEIKARMATYFSGLCFYRSSTAGRSQEVQNIHTFGEKGEKILLPQISSIETEIQMAMIQIQEGET